MRLFQASLLSALLGLSACGRFDFGTKAAIQALVPEAKFLTVSNETLGLGICSPIEIKAWSQEGVEGSPRRSTPVGLSGFLSGDKLYSDELCTKEARTVLLQPGQTSVKVYVKASALGQRNLQVSTNIIGSASQSVVVHLAASAIVFAQNRLVADAGPCQGPVLFNFRDANNAPVAPVSQQILIEGLSGKIYSDAACSTPIADGKLTVSSSFGGAFYVKSDHVAGAVRAKVSDPSKRAVASSEIEVSFRSVPQQLRLDVPSKTYVLGVCDSAPFKVELLDIDGAVTSPAAGGSLRVELSGVSSSLSFRTACGVTGSAITSLTFAPGESSKLVYLEPRSYVSPRLRVYVDGTAMSAASDLTVERRILSAVLSGPSALTAGTVSGAYSVQLLDGVGFSMPASAGGVSLQLEGTLPAQGTLCSMAPCAANALPSGRLVVPAGSSSANFYFLPGNDATAASYLLTASPLQSGVAPSSLAVSISPRVPRSIRITSASAASLNLGVCRSEAFTVDLLDANGLPVAPSSSLVVSLGFAAGAGEYRLGDCGQSTVTQVTFAAGQFSKSIFVKALARSAVTLQASAVSLPSGTGTLQVSVQTVPFALSLSGPSTVVAGRPAGPFSLRLQDGLGEAMSATSEIQADLAIPALARTVYCGAAACGTTSPTHRAAIAAGQSTTSFYVLSDTDASLSPQSMTATPVAGDLRAASMLVTFNRSSLSMDENSGFLGNLTLPVTGSEGGMIHASRYIGGKLVLAGYQVIGGMQRFVVARYLSNRAQGLGMLDASFATNGVRVGSIGDNSYAVALAPQGSNYLVAGATRSATGDGSHDLFLARVLANGNIDTTFRYSMGSVEPLTLAGDQVPTAMVVGTDNTIYVIGHAEPLVASETNTRDIFVAAFNASGTLLENGLQYYDFGEAANLAYAAVLQPLDGRDRILFAGSHGEGTDKNSLFGRVLGTYGSGGSYLGWDSSFGSGGLWIYDLGSFQGDTIFALAQDPISGRIVGAGDREGANGRALLVGLNPNNGNLDGTFGTGATALLDVSGTSAKRFYSLAFEPRTGAIYAAGRADDDFLVARFDGQGHSDGLSPQTARLGVSGGAGDLARSLVLGEDSKPVLSGWANGQWASFQLLR